MCLQCITIHYNRFEFLRRAIEWFKKDIAYIAPSWFRSSALSQFSSKNYISTPLRFNDHALDSKCSIAPARIHTSVTYACQYLNCQRSSSEERNDTMALL